MLESRSPYSPSRPIPPAEESQEENESHDERDARTWRLHAHVNAEGLVEIPAVAFRKVLAEAARYRGEKIKGKGNKTWAAKFVAGVSVEAGVCLRIKPSELECLPVFCHANPGMPKGPRVWRRYPVVPKWSGLVTWTVLDPSITQQVFEEHLRDAGTFVGIGRWRPANGGDNGRFIIKDIKWQKI
jgi:hypothetical protein